MSCYSILYRDGHKYAVPINSKDEFLAIRNHSTNIANLSLARRGNKAAKGRLAQFCYSIGASPSVAHTPVLSTRDFPRREGTADASMSFPLKNCSTVGNSVGMDIDHIEDVKAVAEGILAKKDEIGLLMLERSASGKGLHVIFKRNYALSQEENIKVTAEKLGVEPDLGAKDITRVFFASSGSEKDLLYLDEELFHNSQEVDVAYGKKSRQAALGNLGGASLGNKDFPKGQQISGEAAGISCPEGNGKTVACGEKSGQAALGNINSGNPERLEYCGILYSDIISKWWEMYYGGQTPVVSNRDTLTYELAVNLRHICGFDEQLLDKIIPCYDGFPQEQKMKCIRSAIETKRTQMPRKLRDVLSAISSQHVEDIDMMENIEKIKDEDDAMYAKMLPTMPMGIRDCIDANGEALAIPSLLVSCACIGALATNVKLKVHHTARGLNIYPFICGEFASGKGQMDQVFAEWTKDLQADADEYYVKEEEWAAKAQTKKSGTTEKVPKFPVRMLPLNNTLANVSERLGCTKGKHAISFTPEADMVFSKWKGCMTDFTVMVRVAYDEARYDREAKSADAVRVHIPHLLWNVIMCGTQDSLFRLVTNVTDGFLSRLCICKTPDNTWDRYEERDCNLTDEQKHNIHIMTRMLSLAEGTMEGEELEQLGLAWLEEIRITSMKSFDRVLARQRFRGCINAQRVAGAILLCKCLEKLYLDCHSNLEQTEHALHINPKCWMRYIPDSFENKYMDQVFQVISDALLDVSLYFFRDKLAEAYNDKEYAKVTTTPVKAVKPKSPNNTIYDLLPSEFSLDQVFSQAVDIKGVNVSMNSVNKMVYNWSKQGLAERVNEGHYRKCLTAKLPNCQTAID